MGASSDAIAKPSSHSALTLTLRTQMREKIASRDRVTAQRATRSDERCWENFVACRLLDERWFQAFMMSHQSTHEFLLLLAGNSLTGHRVA